MFNFFMNFINDKVRIGPPAINEEIFFIERNGRKVRGKREDIPKYLADMELNLYEYNAGRGFKFKNKEDLAQFRENCRKFDIKVSVHGPYYISLCSDSEATLNRSIERIGELYQGANWVGAVRAVFHPGGYGKTRTKEECLALVIDSIKKGIEIAQEKHGKEFEEFKKIALCPETAGKRGSLGTLDEIITICREVGTNVCLPTIDFGHIYGHELGAISKKEDYLKIFDTIEKELGKEIAENLHIHYSKVEYTKAGEKEHHPNNSKQWGPDYKPLLEIIHECGFKPTIINESPELETDAKLLMEFYKSLSKKE